MLELIEKGGVIMVLILMLSVVATAIIIERLVYYRRNRVDEDQLLSRLHNALEKGHFEEALNICENNPSPIANLVRVGIENRSHPARVVREMILDAANLEVPRLERFLSPLGTIAHISPLLGLLGTVTGNIRAFGVLGDFGAVADSSKLASGISEALITTAAGIVISIPAIIFYNYLVNKANHTIIRLENRVNELALLMGATD